MSVSAGDGCTGQASRRICENSRFGVAAGTSPTAQGFHFDFGDVESRGVALVNLKPACGWPRLLATGAAQPQEDLVFAPIASCRFATEVASNLCHSA